MVQKYLQFITKPFSDADIETIKLAIDELKYIVEDEGFETHKALYNSSEDKPPFLLVYKKGKNLKPTEECLEFNDRLKQKLSNLTLRTTEYDTGVNLYTGKGLTIRIQFLKK